MEQKLKTTSIIVPISPRRWIVVNHVEGNDYAKPVSSAFANVTAARSWIRVFEADFQTLTEEQRNLLQIYSLE